MKTPGTPTPLTMSKSTPQSVNKGHVLPAVITLLQESTGPSPDTIEGLLPTSREATLKGTEREIVNTARKRDGCQDNW